MIPILYEKSETAFTTNGLGGLGDAISCVVDRVANGMYELTMEYPIAGAHYSDLQTQRIIYASPGDGEKKQPFQIYKISKPINGKITVNAWHISYLLSGVICQPFTAGSIVAAVSALKTNSINTNPFEFSCDITSLASFSIEEPKSVRSILYGDGGILDTFGTGEVECDNWTVYVRAQAGSDNGVQLRYGKNITDIRYDSNMSESYAGVLPYWIDRSSSELTKGDIVWTGQKGNYAYPSAKPVDFTQTFETKPTSAQLKQAAQKYIQEQNIGLPKENIQISFVALWQTEEYKSIAPLERLRLYDIVHVIYDALGLDVAMKVVKTQYNVLKERYNKIEIGEATHSIAKTVASTGSNIAWQIKEESSAMQKAIDHASKLITGGLGGYVKLKENADGQPEELLIMDKPDIDQAVNIIRMNLGGIAFSNQGYNASKFKSAWTIDGTFYADFITAGNLNASLLTVGTITDKKGNNSWDLDSGALSMKKGTINLGSDKLVLTDAGVLTSRASANGKWITLNQGSITGGEGTTTYGRITFPASQDGVGNSLFIVGQPGIVLKGRVFTNHTYNQTGNYETYNGTFWLITDYATDSSGHIYPTMMYKHRIENGMITTSG